MFGDAQIGESEVINVNTIEVGIDPQSPTLSPGKTVMFEVEIRNAENLGRNHLKLAGPGADSQLIARDVPSYTFTALDFALQDPCEGESRVWEISVESTSMTGLRLTRKRDHG